MRYTVLGTSGAEPISLIEAKEYLKVDHSEEDTLISSLIAAARSNAEHKTGLSLVQRRIKQYHDTFPAGGEAIELSFAPIRSVINVQYVDVNGNTQTWSSANYITDLTEGLPPRITPAFDQSYPSSRGIENAVWVTYDAGPASAGAIPEATKAGIYIDLAQLYDERKGKQKKYDSTADYLYQSNRRTFL